MTVPRRSRLCIVAICAAAGLAPVLTGAVTNRFAAARLRRVVEALPGGSLGTVDLATARGQVVLRDLRVSEPGVRVAVERLTIPHVTAAWGGLVQAASAATAAVVLDNVRIAVGKTLIVIPHMEAQGSPSSAADLAKIFDPQQPGSFEDRLAKLSASALTAPELTLSRTEATGASDVFMAVFHDVALTDVVAGHIAGLAVRRITATDLKTGAETSLSTGPLAVTQVDLPWAMRIVHGARSDVVTPPQPVVGSFSLTAVDFKAPDGGSKIGSIRSDAIRGRPPLTSFPDLDALTKVPEAERSAADKQRIADALGDLLTSVALDHVEVQDFSFKDTESDPVSVDLGSFVVDGLKPGAVRLIAAERFSLSTKPANLTLARLALEGYDQSRLIATLKQQNMAMTSELLKEHMARVLPIFSAFTLQAMHIDGEADDLKGNTRGGTRNVFDIPAVDLKIVKDAEGTSTETTRAEVIYDLAADVADPSLRSLVQSGFSHFDLSLDDAIAWNPKAQTVNVDHMTLSGKDLASVSIGAALGHVAPEAFDSANGSDAAKSAVMNVTIDTIGLNVADAGLAAKAWSIAAQGAGISVPLLKAEAKGQAEVAILQALGDRPAAKAINKAVASFIDDPKTLTLSIKAPAGLTLQALSASAGDPSLLDSLEIDAHAP